MWGQVRLCGSQKIVDDMYEDVQEYVEPSLNDAVELLVTCLGISCMQATAAVGPQIDTGRDFT